ncbi:MAG: hypothetical protein QRY71_01900 [Candidatus Rhabdochlamydia sp.]
MTTSTSIALNAFLHELPNQERSSLLTLLSAPFREEVERAGRNYPKIAESEAPSIEILEWVHPSWIAPLLRSFSETEIALFLACFSLEKRESISKLLGFTGALTELSALGKTFLTAKLTELLKKGSENLLPPPFLPPSSLKELLSLDSSELVLVVDLLGVRDLATELKQIIDKQKLIKIYAALSKKQNSYLKVLVQKKEPITFAPMNLSLWTGDADKLKNLIRQRGINRLAKAIYGEHPSLIWYILHRFDTEKARLIEKLSTSIDNPYIAQALSLQTLELIQYIREPHE